MKHPGSVPLFIAALTAACALALALPGQTVATKYLNDLFIFLDGVHRIAEGQVPNRDFHTALGPLVYYVPAVGYWISGTLGGAMPVGMALLLVTLAPVAAHILGSRLRPAVAIPLGAYLLLVVAVPVNLGESVRALSFGMFYNRVGWAALGLLLLMYLPRTRHQPYGVHLDASCAAFLIVLMLYMKISYGIVGIAFLFILLLRPLHRGWAAAALAMVVAAGLLVEAAWGGTMAHISDLRLAGKVSGDPGSVEKFVQILFRNFADIILFTVFVVLTLWRVRSFSDVLFFGFCAVTGFLLISQNFQEWGIVTLPPAAAVAVETLARADGSAADRQRWSPAAGLHLLLLAFVLPPTIHNAAALGVHTYMASTAQGEAPPLPNFSRVKLVRLWSEGEYPVFSRYFSTLADGRRILEDVGQDSGGTVVLDFVNPFSAGLGRKPPIGDSTWYHWGRTVDDANFLPPETMFEDVGVVMEPKLPIEHWTAEGMRRIYADYLSDHFELSHETADWRVHLRRESPVEASGHSTRSRQRSRALERAERG